jgi:hypothetical protein
VTQPAKNATTPATKLTPAAPATPPAGDEREQVQDNATNHLGPDEVANGAAESLHGAKANEEKYVQPAANELPGGSTLIAASTDAEAAREGEKR